MTYQFDLPSDDSSIVTRIRELQQLEKDIKRHVKILQAAHNHTRIKTEGDWRDGYYRYCEDCGVKL